MQLFTIAGVGLHIFREVTVDCIGLAMFLGEWSMLSKSGDFYQAALTKFGGTNTVTQLILHFGCSHGNSHISHAVTVGFYRFERYHGWQGNLL